MLSIFVEKANFYSLFPRDVIDILKCKITKPVSFQLSLVIDHEHPKYISF